MRGTTTEAIERPVEHISAPLRTVWGLTATEVHDAYWESKGVRVVRPGEGGTGGAAGLYLLMGRGASVVLRFRTVMDRMGWIRPALCLVRVGANAGRCGFTADEELAEMWSRGEGRWARLRSGMESEWCGMKTQGRVYGEGEGQALLEHVARVWELPSERIGGVKLLGRGVFGMEGSEAVGLPPGRAKVWVGRGRRVEEAGAGGGVCVLGDAGTMSDER
jgi:hypothetical protein